jgi:hypothetical protein
MYIYMLSATLLCVTGKYFRSHSQKKQCKKFLIKPIDSAIQLEIFFQLFV